MHFANFRFILIAIGLGVFALLLLSGVAFAGGDAVAAIGASAELGDLVLAGVVQVLVIAAVAAVVLGARAAYFALRAWRNRVTAPPATTDSLTKMIYEEWISPQVATHTHNLAELGKHPAGVFSTTPRVAVLDEIETRSGLVMTDSDFLEDEETTVRERTYDTSMGKLTLIGIVLVTLFAGACSKQHLQETKHTVVECAKLSQADIAACAAEMILQVPAWNTIADTAKTCAITNSLQIGGCALAHVVNSYLTPARGQFAPGVDDGHRARAALEQHRELLGRHVVFRTELGDL